MLMDGISGTGTDGNIPASAEKFIGNGGNVRYELRSGSVPRGESMQIIGMLRGVSNLHLYTTCSKKLFEFC
jgi:hypothetical protein